MEINETIKSVIGGLKYNQETQSIEEIKGNDGGISPKFKVGDVIRIKGSGAKGDMITNIYLDEQGFGCFEFAKSDDRRICEHDWELVEPKQEPTSSVPQRDIYGEIKQAEPNQETSELTEFEIELYNLIQNPHGTLCEEAKRLLSIARKQIAKEILAKRDIDTYIGQVKNAREAIPYSHRTLIWNVLADLEDDLVELKEFKKKNNV